MILIVTFFSITIKIPWKFSIFEYRMDINFISISIYFATHSRADLAIEM